MASRRHCEEQPDEAISTYNLLPSRHCERSEAIPLLNMDKQYYVYIMTNKKHTVLYTGVTSDLRKRVYQHQEKTTDGFTQKYNVSKLVYYQVAQNAYSAISREKQI